MSAKFGTERGGWSGGNRFYPLTITARDNGTRITHIDAHVCYYGNLYHNIGVSCGTKVPESLGNSTTGDVSVTDINCKEFSFTNGYATVPFDKITVYFETCEEDGHFMENGFCKICGMYCPHESEPTKTVVSAEKVSCPDCGETLSFTEITEPENTGSVLSGGSLTIICTVAAAAVFGVGGFFLGRKKKKPVTANGVSTEDE